MRLLQASPTFLLFFCVVDKEWNVWLKKGIQKSDNLLRKGMWKKSLEAFPMLSWQHLAISVETLRGWWTFNLTPFWPSESNLQRLSKHLLVLNLRSLCMSGAYHHTFKEREVSVSLKMEVGAALPSDFESSSGLHSSKEPQFYIHFSSLGLKFPTVKSGLYPKKTALFH